MKFYIKQKVFSFKDKFNITNEAQEEQYHVEGKMFSIKNKLTLFRPDDSEVLFAEKKLFRIFPQYVIFNADGSELATVKRKFSLRQNYEVFQGNEELQVDGNFIGHAFGVMKEGREVATIAKKYFSFGDSYEIDIQDEMNTELYLFIVVVIDQIVQAAEKSRNNAN